MIKAYEAILFDLDGTLMDTSADLQKALNKVQEKYGYDKSNQDQTQALMGNGIQYLVEESLKGCDSDTLKEALNDFHKAYAKCFNIDSIPYDGMLSGLIKLRKKGLKLAVVSNKQDEYTQEIIQDQFKEIHFDYVSGAKASVPKKPAADMLLNAAKALNLDVSACLFIGDTEVDIQAANAAKMDVMAIAWGYRDFEQLKKMKVTYTSDCVEDCFETLACV